jgi:hypothetical protein
MSIRNLVSSKGTYRHYRRQVQSLLGLSKAIKQIHHRRYCVPFHRPELRQHRRQKLELQVGKAVHSDLGRGRHTLNSNSTIKFEVLNGILFHNHPLSDGLSCVNRTCLFVFYNQHQLSHSSSVVDRSSGPTLKPLDSR